MTAIIHGLSLALIALGIFFFFAGSLGMLRLRDLHSRLHAVTKADTLGLGLVILGLSLQAESWQAIAAMAMIWVLIMASGATACQLLARDAESTSLPPSESQEPNPREPS